jgi:coronin-2
MPFKVRISKFRHVFGTPYREQDCYKNIAITRNAHDGSFCAVNAKFLAIVTETSGGGSFLVILLSEVCQFLFFIFKINI